MFHKTAESLDHVCDVKQKDFKAFRLKSFSLFFIFSEQVTKAQRRSRDIFFSRKSLSAATRKFALMPLLSCGFATLLCFTLPTKAKRLWHSCTLRLLQLDGRYPQRYLYGFCCSQNGRTSYRNSYSAYGNHIFQSCCCTRAAIHKYSHKTLARLRLTTPVCDPMPIPRSLHRSASRKNPARYM